MEAEQRRERVVDDELPAAWNLDRRDAGRRTRGRQQLERDDRRLHARIGELHVGAPRPAAQSRAALHRRENRLLVGGDRRGLDLGRPAAAAPLHPGVHAAAGRRRPHDGLSVARDGNAGGAEYVLHDPHLVRRQLVRLRQQRRTAVAEQLDVHRGAAAGGVEQHEIAAPVGAVGRAREAQDVPLAAGGDRGLDSLSRHEHRRAACSRLAVRHDARRQRRRGGLDVQRATAESPEPPRHDIGQHGSAPRRHRDRDRAREGVVLPRRQEGDRRGERDRAAIVEHGVAGPHGAAAVGVAGGERHHPGPGHATVANRHRRAGNVAELPAALAQHLPGAVVRRAGLAGRRRCDEIEHELPLLAGRYHLARHEAVPDRRRHGTGSDRGEPVPGRGAPPRGAGVSYGHGRLRGATRRQPLGNVDADDLGVVGLQRRGNALQLAERRLLPVLGRRPEQAERRAGIAGIVGDLVEEHLVNPRDRPLVAK